MTETSPRPKYCQYINVFSHIIFHNVITLLLFFKFSSIKKENTPRGKATRCKLKERYIELSNLTYTDKNGNEQKIFTDKK